MSFFEVGKVVLKLHIENQKWEFKIVDVFNLSEEEFRQNDAFNDTLGNYEPEKELPISSLATINAISSSGEIVELKWSSCSHRVFPDVRHKGWSKAVFVKLNVALKKWRFNGV